jgi:hypothetical protein
MPLVAFQAALVAAQLGSRHDAAVLAQTWL